MRAEAQAHVETINEALALLRRFLDWDRALRRLDELNARAEDSALWNDPKEAEKVMRERTKLESSIGAIKRLRAAVDDNVGLIEMAEAEADAAMVADGIKALRAMADDAKQRAAAAT